MDNFKQLEMRDQNQRKSPQIQDLYPNLTMEDLSEAEYALKRYLELVWRIWQKSRHENRENLTK